MQVRLRTRWQIVPIGQARVVLVLFVASVLGASATMLPPEPAEPLAVTPIGGDGNGGTVPSRRARAAHAPSAVTIEVQIRWWQESPPTAGVLAAGSRASLAVVILKHGP